ncbi:MAG: nucleotidyltransferase [Clostridia bacterium]|nr:nucleotidyltransferase [Clostridia bacterium]
MNVAGVIAEYNPFHKGHLHHIAQTKSALGEDTAIVCCMSGDFVQRGEAAIFSKYSRAEAAARCGADLVFELPLPWAVSSAEGFARGAVGLLGSLGIVTHLSFGSECGEIKPLENLAFALLDPATDSDIKQELTEGVSYAVARQRALAKSVGELSTILDTPNNILGVEYIKALFNLRMELQLVTIPRYGAAHDGEGEGEFRSASEIRAAIGAGREVYDFIPDTAAAVYDRERDRGRGPVLMTDLEPMLLSRLRMLGEEAYHQLPDASEGLGNRIYAAAHEEATWDAVLAAAKTKRYALSRIRRMAICAALGVRAGMADGIPPYARLLAASETGRTLLRDAANRTRVPIVTKPATVKEIDREALGIYNLGVMAHDLYVLGYAAKEERRGGADWKIGPALI